MRTLALLICFTTPSAAAQGADYLIGRPDAGLPGGWGEVSGALRQNLGGSGPDYTLSLYANVNDDAAWLMVYTRIDSLASGRYPVGTVVAALRLEVRPGEEVAWPGCSHARDIVAVAGELVPDPDREIAVWGPVRQAWELDDEAGVFRPLDVDGFACDPMEWYVD